MTRYHRGDIVTTGDSDRTWTVRRIDGSMANLRDGNVLCTAPVGSLQLVRSSPRWPLRVATGAVIALAVICISCIWRVVSGQVPLDYVTSAILLAIASISGIAWMVVLLRGVWRWL